jgi:hypothetical protein
LLIETTEEAAVISQPDFEPGDYHLRVMIEQMEREGRSEHAIVDAVRAASDRSPATETAEIKNGASEDCGRGSNDWVQRLRPSGLHRTDGAVRC